MANVVTVTIRAVNRTGHAFSQVARSAGRIGHNLVTGLQNGINKFGDILQDGLGGALKSAMSTPYIGPIIIGGLAAAAAMAAPIVAALIASAITLGLGGALVGVGAMIVMKNKEVKKHLTDDFKAAGKSMEHAFKPLIPVVEQVGEVVRRLAKVFDPVINKAMKLAQPHLKKFVDELGKAFEQLAPAIGPLMDAFTKILDDIGPELPGMVDQISDALVKMFEAVGEHPEVITETFSLLIDVITGAITVIGWLTDAVGEVEHEWDTIKNAFSTTWDAIKEVSGNIKDFFSGLWDKLSDGAENAKHAISGVVNWLKKIKGKTAKLAVSGYNTIKNWVNRVKGWINGIKGKVAKLAVSGYNTIKNWVDKIKGWINGIKNKTAKLAVSGMNAIQNAVDRVKGWINSIHDKVVNIGVNIGGAARSLLGFATGGIVSTAATGGARANLVMVGEQGPELVRLPFGSQVVPSGQSRAMAAAGTGGALSLQLEWVGGNGGDELIQFLRKNIRVRAGTGSNSVQKALGQ